MYSSLLGRLFLVCVVIFFAMNNTTLGLLAALAVITALNQFGSFVEGMDTMDTPTTVGEDNVPTTGAVSVLTNAAAQKADASKQKVSDLKANAANAGVDKEDIKTAIMSKDSKTIQPDPNMMKNENVEAFTTNMLTPSSLTEGFYAAAPVF